MKKGDPIDVRPQGATRWVRCRVELASENRMSLALSADEGLPLVALDPRTCRQMLLLLGDGKGGYQCVHTGRTFEVREVGES